MRQQVGDRASVNELPGHHASTKNVAWITGHGEILKRVISKVAVNVVNVEGPTFATPPPSRFPFDGYSAPVTRMSAWTNRVEQDESMGRDFPIDGSQRMIGHVELLASSQRTRFPSRLRGTTPGTEAAHAALQIALPGRERVVTDRASADGQGSFLDWVCDAVSMRIGSIGSAAGVTSTPAPVPRSVVFHRHSLSGGGESH